MKQQKRKGAVIRLWIIAAVVCVLTATLSVTSSASVFDIVLPGSTLAEIGTYFKHLADNTVVFKIKTNDEDDGDTDDNIYARVTFADGEVSDTHIDTDDYNDFEKGDDDFYGAYCFANSTRKPWEIVKIGLRIGGSDAWSCSRVTVKGLGEEKDYAFNQWFSTKSSEGVSCKDVDCDIFKRDITSLGGFDSFNAYVYLNQNSSGNFELSWDKKITDQYGTYDCYDYSYAPTFSYVTPTPNNYVTVTAPESGKSAKVSVNRSGLYTYMEQNNLGVITYTFTLQFNSATASTSTFTKTLTIYRCSYGLKQTSINNGFKASTDNYYYNRSNRTVSVALSLSDIYQSTSSIYDTEKRNLASSFSCSAALYSGNDASVKLCDMSLSKSGTTLTFTGTVPMDIDSNGNGVCLLLTGITASTDGTAYALGSVGANSGEPTRINRTSAKFYFSKNKVDTKEPTVYITDVDGNIENPTGHLNVSKGGNIWYRSSEDLYRSNTQGEKNSATQNLAYLQVLAYNGATGTSSTTSVATQMIGITTSTLSNNFYTVVPQENYGRYGLHFYGSDVAGNAFDKTFSVVYYDVKAPVVTPTVNAVQSLADTTAVYSVSFGIDDLCASIDKGFYGAEDDTVFARVYYVFTEQDSMPAISTAAESGGIASTLDKWAFVEADGSVSAIMHIQPDDSFDGTLWYYGEDSLGNKTSAQKIDINVSNLIPRAKITIEEGTCVYHTDNYSFDFTADRARNNYTIEIVADDSENSNSNGLTYADVFDKVNIFYKWTANGATPATNQDWQAYTKGDTVSIGESDQNDGTKLNGGYTLSVKLVHTLSGREAYINSSDVFYFDCDGPEITPTSSTDKTKALRSQTVQILANDRAGVASASLSVTKADGQTVSSYFVNDTATSGAYSLPLTLQGTGYYSLNQSVKIAVPETGLYKLIVEATDANGFETVNSTVVFAIRSSAPTVGEQTCDITNVKESVHYTNSSVYTLTYDVNEAFGNVSSFAKTQHIAYRTSVDNISFGNWTVCNGAMEKTADGFAGTAVITSPEPLSAGLNKIYVQLACVNDGETAVADALAVSATPVQIFLDESAPVYNVTYSNRDEELNEIRTTENVTATVTLTDAVFGKENLTLTANEQNSNVIIESTDEKGKYTVTIKENLTAVLLAKDELGNTESVTVSVSSIDREAPEIEISDPVYVLSGDRQYASVMVTVNNAVTDLTSLALISSDDILDDVDFDSYADVSEYFISSVATADTAVAEEKNITYTITLRGLDGTYVFAVKSADSLGNEITKLLDGCAIALTDCAAEVDDVDGNLEKTKSTSVATVSFNTKLAVLPTNLATGTTDEENFELLDAYAEKHYALAAEILLSGETQHAAGQVLYTVDECGRTYKLSFDPVTEFFEGFAVTAQFTLNGDEITAGSMYAFETEDVLKLTITPCGDYTEQHFVFDNTNSVTGFELSAEESVFNAENGYYTKLVFVALHNNTPTKSASFVSYTAEGNEIDRLQDETFSIYTVDETAPVIGYVKDGKALTGHTAPICTDVTVNLTVLDNETQVASVEISDDGVTYEAIPSAVGDTVLLGNITVAKTATGITVAFAQNATLYVRAENNVGLISNSSFSVSGIDKTPIVEGTHFSISYYYQDFSGEWVKIADIADGRSYRALKAAVVFPTDSGKDMLAVNGSEKILTASNTVATFNLKDSAGNIIDKRVSYALFDNTAPVANFNGLSTTEKTNRPIRVFVDLHDETSEIVKVIVRPTDGEPISLEDAVWDGDAFGFTVTDSDTYALTAYDYAGNSVTINITVSNYNDELPELVITRWSTDPNINRAEGEGIANDPADILSATSVSVELRYFDKEVRMNDGTVEFLGDGSASLTGEKVRVTGILIENPLTSKDVVYDASSRTLLFKKNGRVTVYIVDEYGNENEVYVGVGNINDVVPSMVPVVTMVDDLAATITFEQELDEYRISKDPLDRDESEFFVYYVGDTSNEKVSVADFERTVRNNGVYKFVIYDNSGLCQQLDVEVTGIDDLAPVVTGVNISYEYLVDRGNAEWEKQNASEDVANVYITDYVGYTAATDIYVGTNNNVVVSVETDKETKPEGTDFAYERINDMTYGANGMYTFNLTAANGTLVSYSVDIELIDKDAPVLSFTGANELVYIEGMTADKNPEFVYNRDALIDFTACDIKGENFTPLTDKVYVYQIINGEKVFLFKNGEWCDNIDYAAYANDHLFNHTDVTQNLWSRNDPYYIYYTVFDDVGNETTVRRTIRLVGFYDTIVLINGSMPSVENTVVLDRGSNIEATLKNFAGICYVRYAQGYKTMGEMKYTGTVISQKNGTYTVFEPAGENWYTVYVQTDKRDYFVIHVYVK